MKSFVAYPLDFEKMLFPEASEKTYSGKLVAHYELYKKVSHLEGSVVKCGIAAEEGFTGFAMFRSLIGCKPEQKVVAFEKPSQSLHYDQSCIETGALQYQAKSSSIDIDNIQQQLQTKGIAGKIDFVQGNINDSIPEYLIENPELKISFLNIDFDDYDACLTTLQFFYPRLVHGGILIFDNYYKKEEDYRSITDYFSHSNINISNFSINKGPHYIVRQ